MKIVAGLGNPGRRYQGTRHNVGYDVLACLSSRHGGGKPRGKFRFQAELVDVHIAGQKVLLVAPTTFMNASGRAVRSVLDYYEEPAGELLVVCDDLNLDVGRLRLRASGSSGGQKGVEDIIRALGTQDFARLRIGIGRPPGQMRSSDYVLSRLGGKDRETIELAVQQAADAVEVWVGEGIEAAMNRFNASAPTGGEDETA